MQKSSVDIAKNGRDGQYFVVSVIRDAAHKGTLEDAVPPNMQNPHVFVCFGCANSEIGHAECR